MKHAIMGLIITLTFLILAFCNFKMPTHDDLPLFVVHIEPASGDEFPYIDGAL